jgi:MGT family glycosyltransferase
MSSFGIGYRRSLLRAADASRYPREAIDFSAFSPHLALLDEVVMCPEAFDFPRPPMSRVHYVEPGVEVDRQAPPLGIAGPEDRPLVYASLGSQLHRYPGALRLLRHVLAAAAERVHLRWLVSLGRHFRPEQLGPIPRNVQVVEFAPQIQVLLQTRVAITHGGLNTVKECLFLGVPMVVVPFMHDQPGNAARVAYHGAGTVVRPRSSTPGSIGRAVDRLVARGCFKQRAQLLSTAFRSAQASGIGVRTVDHLLAGRNQLNRPEPPDNRGGFPARARRLRCP